MNVRVKKRHLPALALALCMAAALCLRNATRALAATDCEGDACSQVAVTFDDAKQQFRVQNNSQDRWVRVAAENLAGSAVACAAPGKADYLNLKSIVGPYRATLSEEHCGAAGVGD